MNSRLKKIILLLLAVALLASIAPVQNFLNRDRDRLGLTRIEPLDNAPPVLAFTTVALGGFRGLIANLLWMRASKLQDEDKFFEMVQLADWITKLEPHFAQVWAFEAWNMAWNISVKFKDFSDRWRWVQSGMELLRDEALRYNPNNTLLYQQLSWIFQSKIGQNLDDANMYYKEHWAKDMAQVLGGGRPDFAALIHPRTEEEKKRAGLLRDKYKLDPRFMQQVDERYGPLDWRMPDAQAIYWAALGLEKARENPARINQDDLITLRRVIYQTMNTCVVRGWLIDNPFTHTYDFGPDLDIIPKTNEAYEQAIQEDTKNRDNIETAHRNFLRVAVYLLYEHNRIAEAAKWFRYLGQKYPKKPVLDGVPNSLPGNLTLDQYAVACVQEDVGDTSRDRTKAAIQGLLINSYTSLALGEDDRAAGFKLLANKIWLTYQSKIKTREEAIGLPSMDAT